MSRRAAPTRDKGKRVYRLPAQVVTRHSPKPSLTGQRQATLQQVAPVTANLSQPVDEPRFATRPLPRATIVLSPSIGTATLSTTRALDKRARKPWTVGRVLRWASLAAGLALLGYVGWIVAAFLHLQDRVYKPTNPTHTPNPVVVKGTASALVAAGITVTPTEDPYLDLPSGHINILLLGSDKRPEGLGLSPRSDTLILANLDTQTRIVKMLTIPRDLAVQIPGYSGTYKINTAYFLGERDDGPGGGQSLAVETVSKVFNVPIDYYVMINFEGFRTVVDTLGGIDIDVPEALDDPAYPSENPDDPFAKIHIHFDAGWQHMDGLEALRYARTRHADADFGRSRRQLQILIAMKRKAMSLDLLTRLPGVLDQLGGLLETNIPPDKQLPLLQAGYDLDPSHILTTTIGADLITPLTLSDGSEALKLNPKKAKPVLDAFFGRIATATPTRTPRKRTPTVVPTKTPIRTPTKLLTKTLTKTPTKTSIRGKATATPEADLTRTRVVVTRTPAPLR